MEKLFQSIRIIGLSVLSLLLFSGIAVGASMTPILPLAVQADDLPLFDEALRDPSIGKDALRDDLAMDQLEQSMVEALSDLNAAKGKRRIEVLGSLFRMSVLKVYFYQDALSGRNKTDFQADKIRNGLRSALVDMSRYSSAYAKAAKTDLVKSRALYHAVLAQYWNGNGRAEAIQTFSRFQGRLPKFLQARVEFFAAINDLESGNRTRGEQRLARVLPQLSESGKTSARLALARSKAGLNGQGQRLASTQQSYRGYLAAAHKGTDNLSSTQKEQVLQFSVAVWSTADAVRQGWLNAPIPLKKYHDSQTVSAIYERQGLAAAVKGNWDQTSKVYKALSYKYEGTAMMIDFDRRVVDIEYVKFSKSRQPKNYERVLVQYATKYRETESFGSNQALADKAKKEFGQRYLNFVYTVVNFAKSPKATRDFRNQAISIANNFLEFAGDKTEKRRMLASVAQIHALNNNHRQAVDIYRSLLAESTPQEQRQYLAAAIQSQHVVTNWPRQAPWMNTKVSSSADDRQLLLDLYARVNELNGKNMDWYVVSHMGLLQISLGQTEQAFKAWTPAIAAAPQASEARQAAALMLLTYHSAKMWTDLEKTADLCLSKGVSPTRGQRALDPRMFLADALYFGGKDSFNRQQYAEAVRQFKRFADTFKTDVRRDEVVYNLAMAYHNNAQHPESIKTLVSHVQQYPGSKYNRQALLSGIDWSLPMAYEEPGLFFINRFLTSYKKDTQAAKVRQVAKGLYLGRELYGYLSAMYRQEAEDTTMSVADRVKAAISQMDLEEKFGSKERARWGYQQVLTLAKGDDSAIAQAYAFEARVIAKDNLGQLETIEKKLAGLSHSESSVVDGHAFVRLMIAEKRSFKTKAEIFNLELKDPMATLNQHFQYFLSTKKDFESVCAAGESPFCAPAMMRLAAITQNTSTTIEDLSIPETLDAATVVKFNERKQDIMGTLAETAANSDNASVAMVRDGVTTPTFNKEIVWTNTADWDFDSLSGETGNSFVQWQAATVKEAH